MQRKKNNSNTAIFFFARPYVYAAIFSVLLTAAFIFTLLDAFVIPRALQTVPQIGEMPTSSAAERSGTAGTGESKPSGAPDKNDATDDRAPAPPEITAASYKDENIEITIEAIREYGTDIYIADIRVSSAGYLKTAFAENTFGRNINARTSVIAAEQNAIFAVNGDYCGFRDEGWVLRNGVLYRLGESDFALLMDAAGDLSCESDADSIEEQLSNLWQIWSFGPALILNGEISVTEKQEISGRSSVSNPRTAIGQTGELHYIVIVSDGRTTTSAGLSLYELAVLFGKYGCSVAYNLDGGGSSVMYFNGRIVNNPTTGGRRAGEREVSDIVYIGY